MQIDTDFKNQVDEVREHLLDLKERCGAFEAGCRSEVSLTRFLESEVKALKAFLDGKFAEIWEEVKCLDKEYFTAYQKFIQKKLYRVLVEGIEVNMHIAKKPYGYSGDFEMMNYIYDHCNKDTWLGNNAYEKIVNRYSTNLSVCQGNIFRKEFIKSELRKALQRKPDARILSVGCGPAREITEMIDEGGLNSEARFIFFDFEKAAIEFVQGSLKKNEHRMALNTEFVLSDIRTFILKEMPESLKGCDLIYISGVFDYLKDQTCLKVISNVVKLMAPGGKVIICNMSDEYAEDRSYYELLGDWSMYHRTSRKMSTLVRGELKKMANIDFVPGTHKYHSLTLVNR